MGEHKKITCGRCSGHGQIAAGVNYPDECPDCGGSGVVVEYTNGAIARWYGGPLLSGPRKQAEGRG